MLLSLSDCLHPVSWVSSLFNCFSKVFFFLRKNPRVESKTCHGSIGSDMKWITIGQGTTDVQPEPWSFWEKQILKANCFQGYSLKEGQHVTYYVFVLNLDRPLQHGSTCQSFSASLHNMKQIALIVTSFMSKAGAIKCNKWLQNKNKSLKQKSWIIFSLDLHLGKKNSVF